MKVLLISAMMAAPLMVSNSAQASCGNITIAAFNWQSAEVNTYVDQFILNNGYGCNATVVAGDTVPTLTSMIEKGEPGVAPAVAPAVTGDLYVQGIKEGRIAAIGTAISDGSTSGWYIPKYLADAHPDIKSVDDAMKHPELFPAPEDSSKGAVINGPQGWGSTIITEQLFKALDAENKGFVIVSSGSAGALDSLITRAYDRKIGYIAAYWAPTSLLMKYPMVRLQGSPHDAAEWVRCTTNPDCPNPKPNYWEVAQELTVASAAFLKRDDVTDAKGYFAKRSWTQAEVGKIMLWMTDNQATGEDGAKWFIQNMPEVWTKWVPAEVAEKIKSAL